MAQNTNPIFGLVPKIGRARLTGASTTSDASSTTNLATLLTAGSNGSRIEEVRVHNSQATVALSSSMVIRLWTYDGTNYTLLDEQAMPSATRSTTVIGAYIVFSYPGGLLIPSGTSLVVGQSVYNSAADQNDVIARATDY